MKTNSFQKVYENVSYVTWLHKLSCFKRMLLVGFAVKKVT
ncbi:hypothetical protein HMPREF0541_01158 [Lacticaseibacillus rhamnosus ATCC 21052]|uniref:Uncharacterized protein n=1 Tax=Lacticaseibacillus rhamnosus (strain LMS2-1) TaxID=525361 RepID=C2JYN8_LACRM|nr:conserved hypothetical protein [Lacticaseibacillus rhamnosus ATCC 8530]EEN79844.1 hypothetical protein HMPREF0539_2023 [Lacticaseibacillus rhamnosus LMS2-1]EHJ32534.1 hypothetical protein HMPREF0541_01158 [Lacticaseibacillus rhamnosus ATCC 21052]